MAESNEHSTVIFFSFAFWLQALGNIYFCLLYCSATSSWQTICDHQVFEYSNFVVVSAYFSPESILSAIVDVGEELPPTSSAGKKLSWVSVCFPS